MKYTINNLKCFAKENTLIFILFIFCEFAAAFILFYLLVHIRTLNWLKTVIFINRI